MPFGDWIDFWYKNYCKPRLRQTTQGGYENAIYQHIIPEIGKISLDRLSQNDLQQFYSRLKNGGRLIRTDFYGKGLSDRTVRSCHANCRAALEKAVEEGLIRTNPSADCKLPPKRGREMQVLTREEMQRLLIQAKEEGYFELIILELATGLRSGELLALQWSDIDLDTGELRISKQVNRTGGKLLVSEPKTKASVRTIILPASVTAVMKRYKECIDSRWVFPSPVKGDSPLDPASCRKKLQTILEHAECKRVRFHDLRHTFATTALEHSMDVKTLSAIIGHVSAATTLDIYTHITDETQQNAADNIDHGICKTEPVEEEKYDSDKPKPAAEKFTPYKGKRRKAGTGCISQIGDRLFEGRYSMKNADDSRKVKTVYADTRERCEEKLAALIKEIKAER